MRHNKRGRKFNRNSAKRKALKLNILKSLFLNGQIITTVSKAKEYAPAANKLITIAKRADIKCMEVQKQLDNQEGKVTPEIQLEHTKKMEAIKLAHFRRIFAKIADKKLAQKIFYEIAPLYKERNGGYTKVIKLSKPRLGDNSTRAVLKLVEQLPDEGEVIKSRKQMKAEKDKLKAEKQKIKAKLKEKKEKEKEKKRLQKEKEKARLKALKEKKEKAKEKAKKSKKK